MARISTFTHVGVVHLRLFAGLAGLLAGAFSMAAGEYISVRNQREACEREIGLEAMELRDDADAEAEDLALIYRAKGLDTQQAEQPPPRS